METQEIKRALNIFGHIMAVMVEVEGMKVCNSDRLFKGYSLAYGELAFMNKADEIKALAESILS